VANEDVESGADATQAVRWSSGRQAAGIVIWTSFLSAAITSILCFAVVDPALFVPLHGPDPEAARMTGYALAFFLLWLASATASLLTLYLTRTARAAVSSTQK